MVVGDERVCERCGTPVIKKNLEQWFLKITAYADELLDFSGIEWPERVRTLQTNWIGRSVGVEFELTVPEGPVWVLVDRTRMTQVIGNLLHNAAKFTERGGRVRTALTASGTCG